MDAACVGLDVCLMPGDGDKPEHWRIEQTAAAWAGLVHRLTPLALHRVVVEATGQKLKRELTCSTTPYSDNIEG